MPHGHGLSRRVGRAAPSVITAGRLATRSTCQRPGSGAARPAGGSSASRPVDFRRDLTREGRSTPTNLSGNQHPVEPHHPELRSSGDPRQAGRSPGSLRCHVRRGEPGLHVPDLLVLRLCGQAKSPVTRHLPLPVVRPKNARRCQCGTEYRATPCVAYRFRVPVEGGDPR